MKRVFSALFVCATLLYAGCIDREFDLADVSKEITVGGEELIVPLADVGKITIEELLKDNDLLESGNDGVYQISFSSYGDDPTKFEKFSIEGVEIPKIENISPKIDPISFSMEQMPSSLQFSPIEQSFDVDFPSINNVMSVEPIVLEQELGIKLPDLIKSQSQGTIDSRILAVLNGLNATTIEAAPDNESGASFNAEIRILEEIKKIDWVEFGCDEHPFGTPFDIKINLHGLAGINGGGEIDLMIKFPEGYYLRDENGNDFPQDTHNILNRKIKIAPKQKEISVLVYLHKIDYSNQVIQDGVLKINDNISCNYKLNLSIGEGDYNLNYMPKLTLEAAPQYKDIEVVINHFDIPNLEHSLYYSFNGIPNGVSVEKVAFTDNSKFTVSLKGLEWCKIKDNLNGDDVSPKIEIILPASMRFNDHELLTERIGEMIQGSNQIAERNVLLATATELASGITLSLKSIECLNNNNIKQENGSLVIDEKIVIAIHMESIDGHTVLLSSLTPPENFNISISISEAQLLLNLKETKVTWSEDKSFDLDLGDDVPKISQELNIPDMIKSIKSIEIGKAGSDEPLSMRFSLNAGDTFPVDELDINLAVNLGRLLRPTKRMLDEKIITQNDNGDYIIKINEPWHTKAGAFTKELEFEALDNIPDIINGKMKFDQSFLIAGSVKIKSGEDIDLSTISNAKVDVDIDIDDIEIRAITGVIDVSVEPEPIKVDLSELSKLDLDFNALSLNPVLTINMKDNPIGVGFGVDVVINTLDSEGNKLATITAPTIKVADKGASNIVISTPRNKSKYEGEDVTFVAVEGLSKLFANGLPANITADMKVSSNKDTEVFISPAEVEKGYNIEYQYSVVLPLEMDGEVDLSYDTEITDLNELFTSIADQGANFKTGDIGIIAEIDTNIPFTIVVSAELIDANGKTDNIDARLTIDNCVINGDNSSQDGQVRSSAVNIDLDLGKSHSLNSLRNVDGIRLKLTLYNTNTDSAATINKNQFISGKLKLRVRDGLNIDLSNL